MHIDGLSIDIHEVSDIVMSGFNHCSNHHVLICAFAIVLDSRLENVSYFR